MSLVTFVLTLEIPTSAIFINVGAIMESSVNLLLSILVPALGTCVEVGSVDRTNLEIFGLEVAFATFDCIVVSSPTISSVFLGISSQGMAGTEVDFIAT